MNGGPWATRILWNRRPTDVFDPGDIDEIVVEAPATVHIEQMDDRCWWIRIAVPDGTDWTGVFSTDSKGRMTFGQTDDGGMQWDRDDTHEPLEDR